MAFSIAKAANWLHQVHRAHAVVGWWPDQFAIEDERTAYKVQDALLKKLVPKQGPLVGYKIALTSPQIWEQTGLRGPAYGPIRRKRVFEHKASVRADQWARLGVELEVILTVNADVPRPKDKPEPAHHLTHQTITGERGHPDDVAAMVRFLCGPGARYINGQAIHANGGAYHGA